MKNSLLWLYVEAFYRAFLLLEDADKKYPRDEHIYYLITAVVNGAFACELALKSILIENDISFEKNHNLYELFQLLPDVYKDEIYLRLRTGAPPYDMGNFDIDFTFFSEAYYKWRYAYEERGILHCAGFYQFTKAIVETHLSKYHVTIKSGKAIPPSLDAKEAQNAEKYLAYEQVVQDRIKREKKRKK